MTMLATRGVLVLLLSCVVVWSLGAAAAPTPRKPHPVNLDGHGLSRKRDAADAAAVRSMLSGGRQDDARGPRRATPYERSGRRPAVDEGEAEMSVRWAFNFTWGGDDATVQAILRSRINDSEVFAYVAGPSWVNNSRNRIVALRLDTGAAVFTSLPIAGHPNNCLLFETATTVACVGASAAVVVHRRTGAIVRVTSFLPREVFLNNVGGAAIVRTTGPSNDTVVFVLQQVINGTMQGTMANAALDLVSGHLTIVGTWANPPLGGNLFGVWNIQAVGAVDPTTKQPRLNTLYFIWGSYYNVTTQHVYHALYGVSFGTLSQPKIVYWLRPPAIETAAVTVSLATPAGPIRHAAVLACLQPANSVFAFNATTGSPLFNVSIPSAVAGGPMYGFGFAPGSDLTYVTIVGPGTGSGVATVLSSNYTLWYIDVAAYYGDVTDVTKHSIVMGGVLNERVTKIDIAQGLIDWSTVLPFEIGDIEIWAETTDKYFFSLQPPSAAMVSLSTGRMMTNFSTSPLPFLANDVTAVDAWDLPSHHGGGSASRGLASLLLGYQGNLARLDFASTA